MSLFLNDEQDVEYEFTLFNGVVETGYIHHGGAGKGTTYRTDGTPLVVALGINSVSAFVRSTEPPRIYIPWVAIATYKKLV